MKGNLFLVPNTLGNPLIEKTVPPGNIEKVKEIQVFIVENLRNARRYLKLLDKQIDIDQLIFHELNEHTYPEEIPGFLEPAMKGSDIAIISEAGVPGVADPGAAVVQLAHQKGIRVVPLTGPSSILLSLMASGLNGQHFTFLGYLPVKRPERIRKIREIENEVFRRGETQIFMEAPYRNDAFHDKWRKFVATEPSWTVTAHLSRDTYSHIHYDSRQARTITIREAARLQSFPDAIEFQGNFGDQYRQIGNAVPPLLSRAIATNLLTQLDELDAQKKKQAAE